MPTGNDNDHAEHPNEEETMLNDEEILFNIDAEGVCDADDDRVGSGQGSNVDGAEIDPSDP